MSGRQRNPELAPVPWIATTLSRNRPGVSLLVGSSVSIVSSGVEPFPALLVSIGTMVGVAVGVVDIMEVGVGVGACDVAVGAPVGIVVGVIVGVGVGVGVDATWCLPMPRSFTFWGLRC